VRYSSRPLSGAGGSNATDLALFALGFGHAALYDPAHPTAGIDFDGDGWINTRDLAIFASVYGIGPGRCRIHTL
jgi:hypothetical protein